MSSLPKTMKAVYIEKTGGTEVLQYKTDFPVPEPKDGEVLIRNDYIGINFIDTYFRKGVYPIQEFPFVPGRDGSGTIAALGSGTPSDLKVGSRVAYLGTRSYAEYAAVPSVHVIPVPDAMDGKVAAASLLQGLTAITLIRESYHVQKGDWILVTAAAGGVGLWLCQLLKAVGARVIATASTEEKRNLAKQNGAKVLLELDENNQQAFVDKVMETTGGEGVHAVYDSVGQATFDSSLSTVWRKGTMVSYGNASGPVTGFALARLGTKNVKLLRPVLFNYIVAREEFLEYANEIYGFIQKGEVNVQIHEVYPLSDVVRATKDIEARKTTGKLLMTP